MNDWSQHGEGIVIHKYFEGFTGTLLSIGENDGKTFSNALGLIEAGWSAALIEPCRVSFSKLVQLHAHRNNVHVRNVAIGTANGHQDFYESGSLINGHDYSLVSSLKATETERWRTATEPGHKVVDYRKTKVHVLDWKTFLRSSPYKTFDFITIDIEGMELEVLAQMNLDDLGCKLICVEYNSKNVEKFDALIPWPVLYKNRTNLIYAKRVDKIH